MHSSAVLQRKPKVFFKFCLKCSWRKYLIRLNLLNSKTEINAQGENLINTSGQACLCNVTFFFLNWKIEVLFVYYARNLNFVSCSRIICMFFWRNIKEFWCKMHEIINIKSVVLPLLHVIMILIFNVRRTTFYATHWVYWGWLF